MLVKSRLLYGCVGRAELQHNCATSCGKNMTKMERNECGEKCFAGDIFRQIDGEQVDLSSATQMNKIFIWANMKIIF